MELFCITIVLRILNLVCLVNFLVLRLFKKDFKKMLDKANFDLCIYLLIIITSLTERFNTR